MFLLTLLIAVAQAGPLAKHLSPEKWPTVRNGSGPVVVEFVNFECHYARDRYRRGVIQAWQAQAKSLGYRWITVHAGVNEGPARVQELAEGWGSLADEIILDPSSKISRQASADRSLHFEVWDKGHRRVWSGGPDRNDRIGAPPAGTVEGELLLAALNANGGRRIASPAYGCAY